MTLREFIESIAIQLFELCLNRKLEGNHCQFCKIEPFCNFMPDVESGIKAFTDLGYDVDNIIISKRGVE